jgi:cytochrome c oxidase assembly protein subunit 15
MKKNKPVVDSSTSPQGSALVALAAPSRIPHRIACLIAALVFPLIWIGALVTTYDAGMAVPDWPGTYGYNMFLYPLETWLFGPFNLLIEHGHRLLASIAGLVTIGLVVATFRLEKKRALCWFSAGLLLLIILQGALGGFRVLFDARTIAKIHGCVGPAFFASVVAFCVVSSRWWYDRRNDCCSEVRSVSLTWFAGMMLGASYLQLCVGAFIRHVGLDVNPRYFSHLVLMHIGLALLIVLGTFYHWFRCRARALASSGIRTSINILAGLILIQFTLGLATWVMKYGWPAWFESQLWAASFVIIQKSMTQANIVTAHSATGSLVLAFWMVQFLRCLRVFGWKRTETGDRVVTPGNPRKGKTKTAMPV